MPAIQTIPPKAGLFSAVVTTFSVQSYPALSPPSPDPSVAILAQISAQLNNLQINGQTITSTQPPAQGPVTSSSVPAPLIIVNTLWFTSLIFSLVSASIGILLKQWLREYEYDHVIKASIEEKLRLRQLRYDSLERWRVKEIVMLLPVLLQIALIMFLIGLVELAWTLNPIVAAFVITFVTVALVFTAVTTVLPAVFMACPYRSPQARLFFHLWQWMKSSCKAVSGVLRNTILPFSRSIVESTNELSYRPLHDWSRWEDLSIDQSWFVLDAHILRAVRTAYAGAAFGKLHTTIRPIAVNALGTNWPNFSDTEQCPSGELAKSLDEHLDVAEEYCDHSEDSSILVQEDLLSSLASLLKWDQFQERSWSMIRRHGHRFDVDVYPWADLAPIIQFVKKQISDVSTVSPDIESMEGAGAVIRLSTRMSDSLFRDVRDSELKQFLEFLSLHIRDVSKFASENERRSDQTIRFLEKFFHDILELARKHDNAVTADFVCACEDGFKGMDETLDDDWYWQDNKPGIEATLQAIRGLVEQQQAAEDHQSQDVSSPSVSRFYSVTTDFALTRSPHSWTESLTYSPHSRMEVLTRSPHHRM